MKTSAHIIVSGLVQGVGFRWFVEREAKTLGLTGFVRNLYSGEVEVKAEGERGLIEELIASLKVGNRMSNVVDVKISWTEFENKYKNFQIRI
ncbi:acylphosphatase [candidate division KSB1 bacterium]|nr:acylphosphatase [candidate division KSB1 bacterium]MBL7093186.1 acylphosphatase [candidate division KSB1 bacterium]